MKKAIIEGELLLKSGKQTDIEFYETSVLIPDTVTTLDGAQHYTVRSGLVREAMRKAKNFKAIRTQKVIRIEDIKDDENREMSELEELLVVAAGLSCIPEGLDAYKKDDSKVKALQKAIERAEERKKKQKNKSKELSGYVD